MKKKKNPKIVNFKPKKKIIHTSLPLLTKFPHPPAGGKKRHCSYENDRSITCIDTLTANLTSQFMITTN